MKKTVVVILLVVVILILASGRKYVTETVDFILPVQGRLSSKYGEKRSTGIHNGIDIAAPSGTPVKAAEKGVVTRVWNDATNGNAITVVHYQGYSTGYAHLSKQNVSVGANVNKGDVIGLVGSTGRSTGNHLHFVVKQFNMHIDPLTVIKT